MKRIALEVLKILAVAVPLGIAIAHYLIDRAMRDGGF